MSPLPDERPSITHKFTILQSVMQEDGTAVLEDHGFFLIVGFAPDGTVGELFIRQSKEGSTIGGLLDCWAKACSNLLRLGMSLEEMCAKFTAMSFPPDGMTKNSEIPFARSPVDYVCKYLMLRFGKKD